MQSNNNKNMLSSLLLCALGLVLTAPSALADATDGEYLGFRLGDKFEPRRGDDGRVHITGARVFDVGAKDDAHNVDGISLYVSPSSSIIGSIFGEWYFTSKQSAKQFADRYLANLSTKYDDWKLAGGSLTHGDHQLWVDVEKKPFAAENWPSKKKYRVNIGLIYTPESLGRGEWMAIVYMEANNLALSASK